MESDPQTTVPKQITSLYAWIATEVDGGEGIPASSMTLNGEPWIMPLFGADMERVKSLRDKVEFVARETGARMRLCRFQLVDELGEL